MRLSRKAGAALLLILAATLAWWVTFDRRPGDETLRQKPDMAARPPLPDPLERDLQGAPRRGTPGALEVAQ